MDAKEMTFKVIDFAEAQEVADWTGIILDLEFVKAACSRLLIESEISRDPVLSRALIVSAIITYARCFNQGGGVRLALHDNDLEAMGVDMSLHGYIMELRSKHIAHSVSEFEQSQIGITEDGGLTANLTQYWVGIPSKSIYGLGKMTKHLLGVAKEKVADAHKRMKTSYDAMSPEQKDQFKTELLLTTPGPTDASFAREGLKGKTRRKNKKDAV